MSSSSVQPILALFAHPLGGNPTQYMVEKAFAHHQMDWRYLSLEVTPENLGDAVRGMRAMGFRGGNCADPHRRAVLEHLDGLGETARLAGVVNCILRDHGQLVGENTEGRGMLQAIRRHINPADKRVVLLGSGCVARAIAVELALAGCGEIIVVGRSEDRGRQLVELLAGQLEVPASFEPWEGEYQLPDQTDVLVNATSIASGGDERPLSLGLEKLTQKVLVADVTANPPRTWLVRQAEQHGCTTVDGLEMFVEQAALNFKIWTGVAADSNVLYEAAEEFLEL